MSVLAPVKPSIAASSGQGGDIPDAPVFRLSVDQYHEMLRAGVLVSGDPVELLEGWLIQKMSQNPPHVVAAELTAAALIALALPGFCVRSEKPITLDDSEPEPDVVLARGSTRDYIQRHPGVADLALVIEVANTTLPMDRRMKFRIFARAGIQFYWIINLVDRQIEVYQQPSGPTAQPSYASRQDFGPGTKVPVIVSGAEVGQLAVDDLLP